MNPIDDLIRKRLENLRTDSPVTSPTPSTSGSLPRAVKQTAAEQVESLIAQLSEETSIDNKVKKSEVDIDSQLRSRLERLRSREDCDFALPKRCTEPKKVPAETIEDPEFFKSCSCSELLADLGSNTDESGSLSDESDVNENLCVICDEKKPTLVCFGCDKDVYCLQCFKEFHSEDDEHKTMPYVKKS